MKNLFKIFAIFIAFAMSNVVCMASDNLLHSITLEKNNTGYNVILNTDSTAEVVKRSPSNDEIVLEMSGVTSSETVNAIYKGTKNIGGLVIDNSSPNKIKIFVNAEGIKDSTIMTVDSTGKMSIVAETVPMDKVLWIVFVMALFVVMRRISKSLAEDDDKIIIRKDIKDREIQLYRKYKSQISISPQIYPDSSARMNNMLKKIDRKINDRLTSVIK